MTRYDSLEHERDVVGVLADGGWLINEAPAPRTPAQAADFGRIRADWLLQTKGQRGQGIEIELDGTMACAGDPSATIHVANRVVEALCARGVLEVVVKNHRHMMLTHASLRPGTSDVEGVL